MNHPRAGQTKNAQNLDWHGLTTGVGVARSTTHRYFQELSDRNLIDYGRDRACSAGGRRLQQPLEFDQCRGEQLIFSPENRRSCGLILWAKIKKPVNGLVYRLFVAES